MTLLFKTTILQRLSLVAQILVNIFEQLIFIIFRTVVYLHVLFYFLRAQN